MRHLLHHHDGSATTRSRRVNRSSLIQPLLLGSLVFLGVIDFTRSQGQSLMQGQLAADDWVKQTVETSFGGEARQLAAYRKLQANRVVQGDERAPTRLDALAEEIKAGLTEEMLTRLRGDRARETIFEFENDAYTCGPSEEGGSVFDPDSYACSATCELTAGVPSTPIGDFHIEIVDDLLPTLHAVRSLKVAMTGRDDNGDFAEDPIGGIAFIINLLHTAENPVCLLADSEALATLTSLFEDLEKLVKLLGKVKVPQIKLIAKLLTAPIKRINERIAETNDFLAELCDRTTELHILTLDFIRDITTTLTDLDQFTSLLLPSLIEGTCVSDNTFTLAEELAAEISDRGLDPANPGARRAKRHLLKGTAGRRAPASLPATGNLSAHDRRHFAAALTPHARDLPSRRALMYSDWEPRARSGDELGSDAEGGRRKLALREELTEGTTGVISAAVTVMGGFLELFEALDEVFRTFGTAWVDVAQAVEGFHDDVEALFDVLSPFLELFDILFKIGDIFQFLTCPKFLGFVCFIEDLIAEAIEVVSAPIEAIISPFIDDIIDQIGLPEIDINIVDIPFPALDPTEAIRNAATTLVQEVVGVFIDDPLPALYELNPDDETGLDVMYSGTRIQQTVGIEDCADTYDGEPRLPLLFQGIQRSAWCPRGADFTAASLFPCGGLGGVDPVTGDECVVSSVEKVPEVCVSGNYPPELLNDDGTVNFPDFLLDESDFILQAHYACAKESTVFELALLPAEVLATQGNPLTCSLGRFAVDLAEIATPCLDNDFLNVPFGGKRELPDSEDYTNRLACSEIDVPGNSQIESYLELLGRQFASHTACGSDHMCLVGVWNDEDAIRALLASLVPPELSDSVDDMVAQHMDLYDWGTSGPKYSVLQSGFEQSSRLISGNFNRQTPATDTKVGGVFDPAGGDSRHLTEITCGDGSYLETFVWRQFFRTRFSGRSREDVAKIDFSCYGDRKGNGRTAVADNPVTRGNTFSRRSNSAITMDCRGERGGFKSIATSNTRSGADQDLWGWAFECMDGTTGSQGPSTPLRGANLATCGGRTPIQSLDHFWHRNDREVNGRNIFAESIVVRVTCDEDGSPLQRARTVFRRGAFNEDSHVRRYFRRRARTLAEYEPDVPECERIALENAANCNTLDPPEERCELPEQCESATVRYYCPVPGIDIDLPEPERVANAFGDNNLKDAVVECPEGMVFSPLEVTQGVPPFGGVNGLDDFIAAGCDGTSSTCVYTSPEGQSARVVYQCLCGEGFRPLTNEEGGCDFCPLGTNRTFIDPPDGTGVVLADSCLSCQAGFFGDVESDVTPVPTCHLCPKNTYSDKIGGVGEDICIPCEAGRFTEADGGSTSVDQCVECGVDFECPLGGERTACPAGFWTNGKTDSSACVGCPPGTFDPADGGANSTCTACPPGTFSEEFGQTECTLCPVGTYGRDSGATSCEVCPQSTFQDQEGADVCQECDDAKPYTSSVKTTTAAGCWDEDFRSAVDMVIGGTATVQVGSNGTAAGSISEDPQVVLDLLEAGLLAWADDWAATVLPEDRVTIDPAGTTVAEGELEGQFVLSFKADAENVLVSEAQKLLHMVAYPEVLTDMTASVAQFVRDDTATDLFMSPEPVEEAFEASVVASRDQILPPELINFENPELAELTCSELLARFYPTNLNAIFEVGDGFCNGGVWNTPQCNFDGGDCCASTCTPVSLAELLSNQATTADDCSSEEIGDGFCDVENNNEVCSFDGGDCCSGTCVAGAGGECLEGTFDCRDGSEPPEDTEARAQSCGSRTMQCLDPAAVEQAPPGCADVRRARALRIDESEHGWLPAENAARRLQQEPPTEEDCGSSVIQWGDGVCDDRLNNELCIFDGGDCCAQTCVLNPLFGSSCLFFNCTDPSIGADERVAVFDAEVPLLKNLPAQNLNVTVFECVEPTTQQVIAADNDPCFEGGLVVPTDEVLPGGDSCSFTIVRTWAAEDLSSNSVDAQRTYQVADTEPPILTGLPADGLVVQTDDPNFSFGGDTSVAAVDACSGLEVEVEYTESLTLGQGGDECVRNVSRTWTAQDQCGNSITATRSATVEILSDNCVIGASPSPSGFTAAPTETGEASTAPTALGTIAPTATAVPLQTSAPAALDTIAPTATLATPAPAAALDTIAPTPTPLQPTSAPAPAEDITSAPVSGSGTISPTTTPAPVVVAEAAATASPAEVEAETPAPTTVAT